MAPGLDQHVEQSIGRDREVHSPAAATTIAAMCSAIRRRPWLGAARSTAPDSQVTITPPITMKRTAAATITLPEAATAITSTAIGARYHASIGGRTSAAAVARIDPVARRSWISAAAASTASASHAASRNRWRNRPRSTSRRARTIASGSIAGSAARLGDRRVGVGEPVERDERGDGAEPRGAPLVGRGRGRERVAVPPERAVPCTLPAPRVAEPDPPGRAARVPGALAQERGEAIEVRRRIAVTPDRRDHRVVLAATDCHLAGTARFASSAACARAHPAERLAG